MSLAEQNAAHAKKVIQGVGSHIERLADIAAQIKLSSVATILRNQRIALEEDTFRLPVLGRFRNGKSTFLNALLCEWNHSTSELNATSGPLPVNDLPTTAALTIVDYGDSPAVRVQKKDETYEDWSLDRLQKEGVIRRDPDENQRFFDKIKEFQVCLPSKLLQSGITIIDTPGTDDIRERTEIVEELRHRVDAAFVVLRSDSLGGEDERRFIQSLIECGLTDLFFVVNRRDGRVVDEDIKQETWLRIADLCLEKGRYSGQNLADHNIYFVDAKAALEARLEGDKVKLGASGLDHFERQLSKYLERHKRPAHVRRFVQGADAQARSIEGSLKKLSNTVKIKAEEFRARYKAIQPRIAEINKRVSRIPRCIAAYADRVESALMVSFQDMINDVCRELPEELTNSPIPSLDDIHLVDRIMLPFRRRKILEETEAVARSLFEKRLKEWQENPATLPGANSVIKRLLDEMAAEIEDEVSGIERQFSRIQVELAGDNPDIERAEEAVSWMNRIMIGAVTVLSPDHGYSLGVGGWGGMLRSVVIHTMVHLTILWLGGPFGWAVVGSTFINFAWAAFVAPSEMGVQFRRQVINDILPKIREFPTTFKPDFVQKIREQFAEIETTITDMVQREVCKEEDTLRQQMEAATKSADEKAQLLAALRQHLHDVKDCREQLQNAMIAIESGRL